MALWRKRTLVDLVDDALAADPRDAPVLQLEADLFADDLDRYTPTAAEPVRTGPPSG